MKLWMDLYSASETFWNRFTLSFEREINIVINSIKTLKIMYIIKNHSKKEVGRGYLLAVQWLGLHTLTGKSTGFDPQSGN